MFKEALEFQHELGRRSVQPSLTDLPGNTVLLTKPDGTSTVLTKDRTLRKDKVSSLRSLADWCSGKEALDVWVRERVIEAINYPTVPNQVDSVSLPLTHSQAWQTLAGWNKKGFKQKEAVRLLRGQLADTFDEQHLRVFKSLDFSRRNDGTRSVTHTGESLGRSIELQAQGKDGAIPERIAFQLPVFDFEESPKVTVVMAVEVDAEAETISLFAVGDAFTQGERAALKSLRETLAKDIPEASVYLG